MNIQQSYREESVRGANPVQLIVRLYEQLIEDIRQVAMAIEQNNIERRSQCIKHAILVIGHLQSALDFTHGGKVAKDLDNFYNSLRQSVVQVQFRPSKRGAAQLITDLLTVRQAWIEVERAEYPTRASAPPITPTGDFSPQSASSQSVPSNSRGAHAVAYAAAPDLQDQVRGVVRDLVRDSARDSAQDADTGHRGWNG